MKLTCKLLSFTLLALVVLCGCGVNSNRTHKSSGFSAKDAGEAFDSFHKHYYNPISGVYRTSLHNDKRAAIWTQAIYWDMAMNAYKRTGDKKYLKVIDDIFDGAGREYDNYNWDNAKEWFIYDDIMWWVISLARAHELTGEAKYLELSQSGFDRVWNGSKAVGDDGSYDMEKGGMRWGWERHQRNGKMACINFPTVIGAMTLHNITGDKEYFDKAIEIYDWAREVLFDTVRGRIADHRNDHARRPDWTTNLYNQATFIGAGVMLYKKTGDRKYLQDANLAADYVKNTMCGESGMLPFKKGIEQGIYGAIFAQYIITLIEDGGQEQYLGWMQDNIDTAWKNRDVTRTLTFKDFSSPCPAGDIEVYDASGCVALMQVIPQKGEKRNRSQITGNKPRLTK